MTNRIASRPDHLEPLVDEDRRGTFNFNLFLDDLFRAANAIFGDSLILNDYTVSELQNSILAQNNENGIVRVTNESGGRTLAISDGSVWRGADGTIIS